MAEPRPPLFAPMPMAEPLSSRGETAATVPAMAGPPASLPDLAVRHLIPALAAGPTAAGPVTVILAPPELGTLTFEVTTRGDALHLHLTVDTPATLDLLRRQGDQLLADLRQGGFAQASLSFAGQDGQPGTDPRHAGQGGTGQHAAAQAEPAAPPDRPTLRPTPSGALDLRL